MFIFPRNSLPSSILQTLQKSGLTGPQICEHIWKERPHITKQAIYSALRNLIKDEVIYKVDGIYSINRIWLKQLRSFTETQLQIIQRKDNNLLSELQDGSKVIFQFKDPHLMNVYWDNIFNALLEMRQPEVPVIIYHPHEWFIHARPKTESLWLKEFINKKILTFFSIGGSTSYDRAFQKEWRGEFLQINCGNSYGFDGGYYLNIVGDFIFEVFFDKSFSQGLDALFTEQSSPNFSEKVAKFVDSDHKVKLVVSRNTKKAQKLYRKISKDFVIPKHTK